MLLKHLLVGIGSYIPGFFKKHFKGTGGTNSARYCYSVWLRHMSIAYQVGKSNIPKAVAEFGPGDSLGVGLAALISGSERYYSLDVVQHATSEQNVEIFDRLVGMFKNRDPIPGDDEFPRIWPKLNSYDFPSHIYTDEILYNSLDEKRLGRIRKGLCADDNSYIEYIVPYSHDNINRRSVDMIFSQAVMQYVDDLEIAYKIMYEWLRDECYMSHVVDFSSHGYTIEWNGHWGMRNLTWRIMRGNLPFFLNREPISKHIKYLTKTGFSTECILGDNVIDNSIVRNKLADNYRYLSDTDLYTKRAMLLLLKHGSIQ